MKPRYFNKLAIVFFMQLGIAANVASDEEHIEHKHKEDASKKTETTQERVQHDSHEHGKARLTIAKMASGMEIMLDTPAANIFGFGNPAGDKKERKIVQTAEEKLNAGSTLFITNNAANCTLKDVDIDSDIIDKNQKNKHHSKDDEKETHQDKDHTKHDEHHSDDDHKDKDYTKNVEHNEHHSEDDDKETHHKDKEHAKHDEHHSDDGDKEVHDKDKGHAKHDEHPLEDDHKEAHSDVEVTWVFQCEKLKALTTVEVKLFSQFPKGFQHLNVEWITNSGAGTATLAANGIVKLGK